MHKDVPLVIPEVNPDHVKLLECQSVAQAVERVRRHEPELLRHRVSDRSETIARAIWDRHDQVVTMQAVSGAGYPGVPSLDILGNVIPYIPKEEEKMEEETRKLLGKLDGSGIVVR